MGVTQEDCPSCIKAAELLREPFFPRSWGGGGVVWKKKKTEGNQKNAKKLEKSAENYVYFLRPGDFTLKKDRKFSSITWRNEPYNTAVAKKESFGGRAHTKAAASSEGARRHSLMHASEPLGSGWINGALDARGGYLRKS